MSTDDTATSGHDTDSAAGASASASSAEDGAIEYEEEFKHVEKYNIISVSGCDRDGRPIIVFSACRLPASSDINHDVLFRYMMYTLDKVVEQDYTVLYCHYGLESRNKPPLSWLRQVYKEMDRKYKKNIKKFYVLHPTYFIKFMMSLMKPFINYKFGKKVAYINRLAELEPVLALDQLELPEEVKQHDRTLRSSARPSVSSASSSTTATNVPKSDKATSHPTDTNRHTEHKSPVTEDRKVVSSASFTAAEGAPDSDILPSTDEHTDPLRPNAVHDRATENGKQTVTSSPSSSPRQHRETGSTKSVTEVECEVHMPSMAKGTTPVKKPPPVVARKPKKPSHSTRTANSIFPEDPSSFIEPARVSGLKPLSNGFRRPRGPQGRNLPSRFSNHSQFI